MRTSIPRRSAHARRLLSSADRVACKVGAGAAIAGRTSAATKARADDGAHARSLFTVLGSNDRVARSVRSSAPRARAE